MLILIEKDSATQIPKDVTFEQAKAFANDFTVYVVSEDGSKVPFDDFATAIPTDLPIEDHGDVEIETREYSDGSSATGIAPLPELSPDQQNAQSE